MSDPVVALEIGTSKIVALVGEQREDGGIMITGMGERSSVGVRKGEVIDLENAVASVRTVLDEAEERSKVAVEQVHVVVSGGHVRGLINRGAIPIHSAEGEITEDDVEDVMEVARAVGLPDDRQVMHTICRNFCIDDEQHVVRPIGMVGARLALDMLVLHGVRSRIRNTIRVAEMVPVDVADVAFGGLCAALAVLTPEQKKTGAVVIDLGGGTTDYMAYAGGVVALGGALGVGGDHVTNDIALAFNIPLARAESLKREQGSAIVRAEDADERFSLPAEVGFHGTSIRLRGLQTVINARVEEMFRMIRKRLDEDNLLAHAGAGIILTGGGALLDGVAELATRVFGAPCFVGRPRNVSGIASVSDGPAYAACTGLVQYAFKTQEREAGRGRSVLDTMAKILFGR